MSDRTPLFCYQADVLRVIDGDTIVVNLDLGFRTWQRRHVRLVGAMGRPFDTAEINARDPDERATAEVAQRALGTMLGCDHPAPGRLKGYVPPKGVAPMRVVLRTYRPDARDALSRYLAHVATTEHEDVADRLVRDRLGTWLPERS